MIHFSINDGVGNISLSINDKNTFSREAFLSLQFAIRSVKESKAKLLVLKTDRRDGFSLGLDLQDVHSIQTDTELSEFLKLFYENLTEIYQLQIPTIVEISGHALGYGAMLALVCDYRFALSEIRFGLPEVKLGIQVPSFIFALLGKAIGFDAAKRHVLLGDAFKAKEYSLLFEEITETPEELQKKSKSLQNKLKKNSFSAMKDTKSGILKFYKPYLDLVAVDIQSTIESIRSSDAKEGISAAVNGRRPIFIS